MLNTLHKINPEIIIPDDAIMVVHHNAARTENSSYETNEGKNSNSKYRRMPVFRHALMPEQPVNYIKPKRFDFL